MSGRLRARMGRIGVPAIVCHDTGCAVVAKISDSRIDTSRSSAPPPYKAAAVCPAANIPAAHSPSRPPAINGGRSGAPRCPGPPDIACNVSSVAGRSVQGPRSPKSVMVVMTAPGLSSLRRAGASARAMSLCGDHRITSAAPIVVVSSSGSVATTEVEPAARN